MSIQYPEDFGITLPTSFSGKVVCSFDRDEIDESEYCVIELPHGKQKVCFVGLAGFEMFSESQQRSSTSGARYYAGAVEGSEGWLVQYLKPGAITSCHHHVAKIEQFFPLAGEAKLLTGTTHTVESTFTLKPGLLIPAVLQGIWHQLYAESEEGAVVLIKITDLKGMNPLGREDYHYHDSFV